MMSCRIVVAAVSLVIAFCLAMDRASARQSDDETTTVLVFDAEQKTYLATEIPTPRPLRDSVVLRKGANQIERIADASLAIRISGVVADLHARIRSGEWVAMPGGLVEWILAGPPRAEGLRRLDAAPRPSGSCFTTFRSRNGLILCADGCSDCYVEKVTP